MNFIHTLLQYLAWFLVKSLISTYRFEKEHMEHLEIAKNHHPQGALLLGCWHEQMIGFLAAHAWSFPYMAMASRSKDGDYAAFLARKMGFTPVRGSSRKKNKEKGGKAAIETYISNMQQGGRGGITVDGPKGPRHECKPGIVLIASETGAMIIPGAAIAEKKWVISSAWDKFQIPKPFTKIKLIYADPIAVEKDLSPEEVTRICRLVEQKLSELEAKVVF